MRNSPSHGFCRASPLKEGAEGLGSDSDSAECSRGCAWQQVYEILQPPSLREVARREARRREFRNGGASQLVMRNSPSHGKCRASPLKEGAEGLGVRFGMQRRYLGYSGADFSVNYGRNTIKIFIHIQIGKPNQL